MTIFFVIGAAHRQRLQRWALVSEPLGRPGIAAADDLVDKPAAGSQPVEIARTAHQSASSTACFQMAKRAFD